MPKENKSDDATLQKRISLVNNMLCAGKTTEEIWLIVNNETLMLKEYNSNKWDISLRTAYEYVAKCRNNWAEYLKKERQERLEEYISKKDFLYKMAISKGLVKDANDVLDSKAKIEGIWIDKIAFTDAGGNDINNIEIRIQKREDIPDE